MDEKLVEDLKSLKHEIDIALQRGFLHVGLVMAISIIVLSIMLFKSNFSEE